MGKVTKLAMAIVSIGVITMSANYARADEDCCGKCHDRYTVYMPLVYNSPVKAGYAWSHNRLFIDVLGMKNAHTWNIHEPEDGYIPHLSCDVRPYGDAEGHNQYTDLLNYVRDYGDAPFVLILLNEPDRPDQCTKTPLEAAYMYKKVLEIAPNAIVTTPQVSHLDYQAGWVWMREWYKQIDNLGLPHPEIGGIHTYINEPSHMIIDSFMGEFDVDRVWVTEWGATSPAVLLEMLDTFETDERIEKHFYFDPAGEYWPSNQLIEANGDLTPLGDAWVGYFEHDIE